MQLLTKSTSDPHTSRYLASSSVSASPSLLHCICHQPVLQVLKLVYYFMMVKCPRSPHGLAALCRWQWTVIDYITGLARYTGSLNLTKLREGWHLMTSISRIVQMRWSWIVQMRWSRIAQMWRHFGHDSFQGMFCPQVKYAMYLVDTLFYAHLQPPNACQMFELNLFYSICMQFD